MLTLRPRRDIETRQKWHFKTPIQPNVSSQLEDLRSDWGGTEMESPPPIPG